MDGENDEWLNEGVKGVTINVEVEVEFEFEGIKGAVYVGNSSDEIGTSDADTTGDTTGDTTPEISKPARDAIPHACSMTVGGFVGMTNPGDDDGVEVCSSVALVSAEAGGTAKAGIIVITTTRAGFWICPSPICDTGVTVTVCMPPWTWPSAICETGATVKIVLGLGSGVVTVMVLELSSLQWHLVSS